MGNRRARPTLLPGKLLAIREFLNLGQPELAEKLQLEISSHSGRNFQLHPARISQYETGEREPNLFVLIAYGRLGRVNLEYVADDEIHVENFRKRLGKGIHYVAFSQSIEEEKRNKPLTIFSGTK